MTLANFVNTGQFLDTEMPTHARRAATYSWMMRFLDHARAAAQPHFGSETTVAALPVWPAGAAIGGGVADRFVQSSMMLVLGTERLGIFSQKPLRHAVDSFLGHVALTDIPRNASQLSPTEVRRTDRTVRAKGARRTGPPRARVNELSRRRSP